MSDVMTLDKIFRVAMRHERRCPRTGWLDLHLVRGVFLGLNDPKDYEGLTLERLMGLPSYDRMKDTVKLCEAIPVLWAHAKPNVRPLPEDFYEPPVEPFPPMTKTDRFGDKVSPDCKLPLENLNPKMISNWGTPSTWAPISR